MNAKGIPIAAYQVLHLLSCTRWGTPQPGLTGGGIPEVGVCPCWGILLLARSDGGGGYPRWGTPCWGTPRPGLMGGTQGGVPPVGIPPSQVRQWGGGYPRWGTPPGWLDLAGVAPGRCVLTNKVKLLPSLSYYVRGQ